MWKRLLAPMPCDRRCRVRMYLGTGLYWAFVLVSGGLALAAWNQGWWGLSGRQCAAGWVGILFVVGGLSGIALCRTQAAYGIWRETNPSPRSRLFQSRAPAPALSSTFTQRVVFALIGCGLAVLIGVVILLVVFW